MNEKAKPTPGPWYASKPEHAPYFGIHCEDGRTVAGTSSGLSEDDAALIAEAGTVYHETGLTPRQLAEQRKELMEALERVCREAQQVEYDDGPACAEMAWEVIEASCAAVAHARGEKQP